MKKVFVLAILLTLILAACTALPVTETPADAGASEAAQPAAEAAASEEAPRSGRLTGAAPAASSELSNVGSGVVVEMQQMTGEDTFTTNVDFTTLVPDYGNPVKGGVEIPVQDDPEVGIVGGEGFNTLTVTQPENGAIAVMKWDVDDERVADALHSGAYQSGAVIEGLSSTPPELERGAPFLIFASDTDDGGLQIDIQFYTDESYSSTAGGFTFNVPGSVLPEAGAAAASSTACADAVQGKIAWDYNGSMTWNADNIQRLCAGAESSVEPASCFEQVMHSGSVDWGGGTEWEWNNALDLCASTLDAAGTIECFEEAIADGDGWETAITNCGAEGPSAPAAAAANVIDDQAIVTGVNRPGDATFDTMTLDFGDVIEAGKYAPQTDDPDVGIVAGSTYNIFMITQEDKTQAFIVWSPERAIWQDLLSSTNTTVKALGSPGPNTLMRGDDVHISVQEAEEGGIDVTLDVWRDNEAVATFSFVVEGEYPAEAGSG